MLPPGRARLATSPVSTGSAAFVMTYSLEVVPTRTSFRWAACRFFQSIQTLAYPRAISITFSELWMDTLVLGTSGRVRLIGVNTPETVHPKKAVEALGKGSLGVHEAHGRGEASAARVLSRCESAQRREGSLFSDFGLCFLARWHASKRGERNLSMK